MRKADASAYSQPDAVNGGIEIEGERREIIFIPTESKVFRVKLEVEK